MSRPNFAEEEPGRHEAIETALGESVEFIQWTNDPGELVIACLYPLLPEAVAGIELDGDTNKASVKVDGWKSKRTALGKGDFNLRLAREITQWNIEITDITEEKDVDSTIE